MYSVLLLASFGIAPDIPDSRAERVAARRSGAGCSGNVQAVQFVAVAASGCSGSLAAAPAAGCAGGQGRAFTPIRNAVARHDARVASRVSARAARPVTLYHAPTATYQSAPGTLQTPAPPLVPSTQSAAPAVYAAPVVVRRTPVRTFLGNCCPLGGCPSR